MQNLGVMSALHRDANRSPAFRVPFPGGVPTLTRQDLVLSPLDFNPLLKKEAYTKSAKPKSTPPSCQPPSSVGGEPSPTRNWDEVVKAFVDEADREFSAHQGVPAEEDPLTQCGSPTLMQSPDAAAQMFSADPTLVETAYAHVSGASEPYDRNYPGPRDDAPETEHDDFAQCLQVFGANARCQAQVAAAVAESLENMLTMASNDGGTSAWPISLACATTTSIACPRTPSRSRNRRGRSSARSTSGTT